MSVILDGALSPPHLLQNRSAWPCPYSPYDYPAQDLESPSISPHSIHSYMSRLPESPLPSQELSNLPSSSWYGPSVSAPASHNEVSRSRPHRYIRSHVHGQTAYAAYAQYAPPHTSSHTLSPPTSTYRYIGKMPASTTQLESSATALSPASVQARDSVVPDSNRPSEEPQGSSACAIEQSPTLWRPTSHLMDRPPSSSSSMHAANVDTSWPMNPITLHPDPSSIHPDQFYTGYQAMTRGPHLNEPCPEALSSHDTSPQSRRMYPSIAPQPLDIPRSSISKRSRDDEEEAGDDIKRRKRSDSNASAQFELSDEDRLLLQLKEEESMPWKDIAARFQTDLGKSYQIPALQMRLKRLRERMRVWTETDVRALRMAHEYWAQNKFEIISQKMLEFGAQEKWTARQCARKFAEIDPAPTPYAHFDHLQHGFASYAMSPVEPPRQFVPYMNVQ